MELPIANYTLVGCLSKDFNIHISILNDCGFLHVFYCILCGWIKGYNSSITTILCQVGSYRTVDY